MKEHESLQQQVEKQIQGLSKEEADQVRHSLEVQLSLTANQREAVKEETDWHLNRVRRIIESL